MRIGIDCTAAVEQAAGIGRFTRELASAMLRQPHQQELVLLAPRGAPRPNWVPPEARIMWCTLPFSSRLASILWQRLRLPVSVQRFTGPLDLYHAPDYLLPPLGGCPGAVTIHDLSFLRHPELAEPRLVRYLEQRVPAAIAGANLIMADSEHTRQDIIKYFKVPNEQIAVVHGGVSDRFQPAPAAATAAVRARYGLPERMLLMVSRLEPRKNIVGLLNAYRIFRDRSKMDVPLVIAGSKGWRYQPIFDTVAQLNLTSWVHFLGHVPDEDLPALLTSATIFVYPSFYEGFGLPPLEAMACGVPVIASNTSSLPEVLGNAAMTVTPTDTEGLANAIELLLNEEALRVDLGARGKAQAMRFTWEAAAEQQLTAYQRLDRS